MCVEILDGPLQSSVHGRDGLAVDRRGRTEGRRVPGDLVHAPLGSVHPRDQGGSQVVDRRQLRRDVPQLRAKRRHRALHLGHVVGQREQVARARLGQALLQPGHCRGQCFQLGKKAIFFYLFEFF